jgi:signal peptidase I
MMTMVMSGLTAPAFGKRKTLDQLLAGLLFFIYLPLMGFGKDKFSVPEKVSKEKRSTGSEWLEAITFAVIAATIIRTFFIEAYTIPTSSMEKSLLIGDYLL